MQRSSVAFLRCLRKRHECPSLDFSVYNICIIYSNIVYANFFSIDVALVLHIIYYLKYPSL